MQTKYIPFLAYSFILLLIFALIPFHAPISVFYGTLLPDYALIVKSWKEILLAIAFVLAIFVSLKYGTWRLLLRDKLFILITAYALLHLLLLPFFDLTAAQAAAGLAIDLRYLLFFVLLYMAVIIAPHLRRQFLIIGGLAAAVVTVFSLLQIFILPVDVLKYIGYGPDTIEPYLTIDKNADYIRINGTLRGPNPLGAYALIVMSLAAAFVLHTKNQLQAKNWVFISTGVLLAVSPAVVWASYSRSALVAAIVSVLLVALIMLKSKLSLKQWAVALGIPALIVLSALYIVRDSAVVQNVLVHSDPNDTVMDNSNEGHVESLIEGTQRVVGQPFGAGPGSTGSASLFSDSPLIIENQYLFIAHESGWLGLALFTAISAIILLRLWRAKSDWLSVGVLASGIGLALIGLLLPVWADDTVSIVWWGLAALALASTSVKTAKSVL